MTISILDENGLNKLISLIHPGITPENKFAI
jgi:hypothetical protein